MKTIHNAYVNALLADAAYRDLDRDFDVGKIVDALETRMTENQAKFIADNFDVIASENQRDIPLLGSGFDATVWRGKAGTAYAGEVYVSMRGTQPQDGGADLEADADPASRGIAYNQLRDMANWWMRVTAKPCDLVKQIKVDTIARSPLANIYTFAADISAIATGELYGQVNTITGVNGHSLGGYLATAFTRLFGAKVSAAISFIGTCLSNPTGNAKNHNAWRVFS